MTAKLYFRYGAMGAAKSLNLLAVAHNYRSQNKSVVLIKPRIDDRVDVRAITSRAGLSMQATIVVDETTIPIETSSAFWDDRACVLVDEAQFLSPTYVEHLRLLTVKRDIPVICYGLRTDFRSRFFPGSQRLMELADTIEEIKTTCHCGRKATHTLLTIDGKATTEGPQVQIGDTEYVPVCWAHYSRALGDAAWESLA